MKQNGECRVSHCGECPDIEINYGKGYRCRKLSITKEFSEDLFSICRLPELKEIKIWFESRPEEADIMDVCVAKQSTMMSSWTGAGGMAWKIEIKNTKTTWVSIAEFSEKEQAEAFLGCKIPE